MEKDLNKENLLVEEKEDCNLTTSSSNSEDENLNNIPIKKLTGRDHTYIK